MKYWKFPVLFLAGSWVVGSLGTALGQCGGGSPVNRNAIFHVVNVPILPRYYHNFSTAQIEGLQNSVKLTSRNMDEPGLTSAEQSLDTSYQCGATENMETHRFCVWADSVEVGFSYTKMDVYISSQYSEGTCPYRAILEHEDQHVAINQGILKKYVGLMRRAIQRDRTIPTKDRPLATVTFKAGQDIIAARVSHIIQPLYEEYKREVLAANRRIDTPQNYRRIQAQCRDW